MATVRQKKLAKAIAENTLAVEPLNAGELLESVGYATSVAEGKPGEIIEQPGVQNELKKLGFNEEDAKAVVIELMNDRKEDGNVRLRAAGEVFKVMGSYAAEKTFNLTATSSVDELKSIIQGDLAKFRSN